jgi:hypothetical protein
LEEGAVSAVEDLFEVCDHWDGVDEGEPGVPALDLPGIAEAPLEQPGHAGGRAGNAIEDQLATGEPIGEPRLVFDTSRSSRTYGNLSAFAQVALVIGWDNEMTVQCEGTADIPTGADHDRCLQAYLAQYPDGAERAHDPEIVHVRVRPSWLRYSDYRPGFFTIEETNLGH